MVVVGHSPKPRRRTGRVIGVLLGLCVLAGAGGGYLLASSRPHPAPAPGAPALPTTGADGAAVAAADTFLAAWSRGDFTSAGAATDAPATASAFLQREAADLGVTRAKLTATSATQATGGGLLIGFTAALTLGSFGTWSYTSSLEVSNPGPGPVVGWSRSVYNPALDASTHLRLQSYLAPRAPILGGDGTPITVAAHPGLASVLGQLQAAPAAVDGLPPATGTQAGAGGIQQQDDATLAGTPGIGVQIVNDADGTVASTLYQIKAPVPGTPVRTTLDPAIQTAAEHAVGATAKTTAFVVLRPSTGAVLAVVNAPGSGFDSALLGAFAPGSTGKVISATALLSRHAVTPSTPVPCPPTITVGGRSFHNDEGESNQAATFAGDFAASCNTAFISLAPKLSATALSTTAATYYGIGTPWHIGVPNTDGAWPDPGSDPVLKAADVFGQGDITANPLVMASVAATVENGQFHQPVLLTGTRPAATATALPAPVDAQLKQMMRLTATSGTAAPQLALLPGDVGAKTGSAEVDDMPTSNGWLIAYRGDLAMAGIVVQGGTGVDSVGPIVRAFLTAVPA